MNTRNESRSTEVREKNTREEEWTFEEPDALDIPALVKARFDNEGMSLRWLRIMLKGRGDLALAKMPTGKVKARKRVYEKKANDMMDAVNAQLMKSSDSRMPITNSSKSVTTRGRQPSFQD